MPGDRTPYLVAQALEVVAENSIREAENEGRFEDLPGEGRPIPGIDEPYDPDWWIKSWFKTADLRRPARSQERSASPL